MYLLGSLGVLIVGLLGLLIWKGFAPDRTFSQKAATSISSLIYNSLVYALALPLMYLFFTRIFIPQQDLGNIFFILMVCSLGAQFVCTLLPERGATAIPHRIVTGISGVLLLPLLIILAASEQTTNNERIIISLSVAMMLVLLVVGLMNQRGLRYALLAQVAYYVLFFAPIVLMVYS